MSLSFRFRFLKKAQTVWLNALKHDRTRVGIGLLAAVAFVLIVVQVFRLNGLREPVTRKRSNAYELQLFIAIGSAPQNSHLRQAARETWLTWLPSDGVVLYRFFTDAPPPTRTAYSARAEIWRNLAEENSRHNDIVQQPLPTGYGDNEHNAYGRRALFQAHWATQEYEEITHFLRIDDDSFLCLHRLVYELKSAPREQFFWGRFWCRQGRNRADENFMLFSADIVRLLADRNLTGRLLPFDDSVTLGWNFGYWSWVLNLTIFDDQLRLDAQQGYLTRYMHENATSDMDNRASFCNRFMYAHHVPAHAMRAAFAVAKTHLMYKLPVRRGPSQTCSRRAQSFVPGRHSKSLPNLRLERIDVNAAHNSLQ